jgi:hypothetical protein
VKSLLTGNIGEHPLLCLLLSIISSIFTYIPMIFFYGSFYYTPDGNFEQNPFTGTLGMIFFVFYGISMLLSFFFPICCM